MYACSRRHTPSDDPALSAEEREARHQVRCLRGFYAHVAVFVSVNAGLLAINLLASPGRLWFQWPLIGWGIWLLLHATSTFGRGRFFGRDWEERKVRDLLAKR